MSADQMDSYLTVEIWYSLKSILETASRRLFASMINPCKEFWPLTHGMNRCACLSEYTSFCFGSLQQVVVCQHWSKFVYVHSNGSFWQNAISHHNWGYICSAKVSVSCSSFTRQLHSSSFQIQTWCYFSIPSSVNITVNMEPRCERIDFYSQ